jgi:uncharacterized protein (DUF1684 family)
MRKIKILIALFIVFNSCAQKKESIAITESKEFQYELNLDYADIEKSPLTKKDFKKFKSLEFFKINEDLRVIANFKRTPNEKPFEMLTTTSRLAKYVTYGIATFNINNKKYQLNIYKSTTNTKPKYKDYLFLPFTDLTNNNESYAGGRFISLNTNDITKENTIVINFNTAYNPYCAYNHKYSCPIPPKENHLNIRIDAGILKYH